ncbi:MAG: hypothetical protein ABI239_12065 [Aquihabitans sp.]
MAGHRLNPWSGRAALVVGALAILAACSSDGDQLDQAATERAIEEAVEGDLPVAVAGVYCPDVMPHGEGLTVRCEAALTDEVGSVGLEVEQMPDDELDVSLLDAAIDPSEVAEELEKQLLATYLRTFTADCGQGGLKVLPPGRTMSCTVVDENGSRDATVTVVDASGTLSFLVASPPPTSDLPPSSDGPATFEPAPTTTIQGTVGD